MSDHSSSSSHESSHNSEESEQHPTTEEEYEFSDEDSSTDEDWSPRTERMMKRMQKLMRQNQKYTEMLIDTKMKSGGSGSSSKTKSKSKSQSSNKKKAGSSKTHANSDDSVHKERSKGCSFKAFKACGPHTFAGTADPVKALEWVTNMEKVFRISKCAESDRVSYATALLTDGAMMWWESVCNSLGRTMSDSISWAQFKIMLDEKYCPIDTKDKLEKDLMELTQGTMSVTEYEIAFTRLALLSDYQVVMEYRKIDRFVQGLHPDIREFVRNRDLPSYEKTVEYARIREREIALR